MARDWQDLFITGEDANGGAGAAAPAQAGEAGEAGEERRVGRFRRLRENLRRTRQALTSEIQATLFEDLSDETWERLEEALIYADVGARTTAQVVEQLEQEATGGKITGGEALTGRLTELLARGAPGIHFYTLNRSPATRAILAALRLLRPWVRREVVRTAG